MYESYLRFCALNAKGLRKQANASALKVIDEYKANPEDEFPYQLVADAKGNKVHYLLFRQIVFPFLQPRIDNDPSAIRCSIETIQNVYQDKAIHEALEWITEEQLLRRLLALDSDDRWAKNKLLDSIVNELQHTIHEWPTGVLYGCDGASLEECQDILETVRELRDLDESGQYSNLADEVETKTIQYRNRLTR